MSDASETLTLDFSSETVALEAGYALLDRAQTLHDNPVPDNEDTAEELKEKAWTVIEEYGEYEE